MGMTLKACKYSIIPQPYNPKYGASNSANYILQIKCKNYIIRREKLKQVLKRLLTLVLRQCDDTLKVKLRKRNDFK